MAEKVIITILFGIVVAGFIQYVHKVRELERVKKEDLLYRDKFLTERKFMRMMNISAIQCDLSVHHILSLQALIGSLVDGKSVSESDAEEKRAVRSKQEENYIRLHDELIEKYRLGMQ